MASLVGTTTPWMRIRALNYQTIIHHHQSRTIYYNRSIFIASSNRRRSFSVNASSNDAPVRVRFAPSPTGNLHVGGARTALFNYLFARSQGGKFILRIEDTDLQRSTKESEQAVLQDLNWLGLNWDEGPGVGGDYGPYRQSERNAMYKEYAQKLVQSGHVYRCFCSTELIIKRRSRRYTCHLEPRIFNGRYGLPRDQLTHALPPTYAFVVVQCIYKPAKVQLGSFELERMKEIAKEKQLPPVYTGKWATATDKEVQDELVKGTSFTYRFRVPKEGRLKIDDLIRGEVSWNLDTLGDFVIMRSNGQPVYNFCVTVDDATMAISHVIRAEEHLPNTLRQALIYKALGFPMPHFAHVSLILAPDRSKLSKRHGATSVGQYREMGYLPQGMVNYLALLGWGDGTEDEFFSLDQLVEKFTISRVNKSGAVFDSTKLRWMNGQHLKSLPSEELTSLIGERWKSAGILTVSKGTFVEEAVELLKDGIDVITDSDKVLSNLLSYPLHACLKSAEGKPVIEDKLSEVSASLLAAYDNGELIAALEEGPDGWKKWIKGFGKSIKRKGKSLFMPLRVLLTGKLHGPAMGESVLLIYKAGTSEVVSAEAGFVTLDERIKVLRAIDWDCFNTKEENDILEPVGSESS